MVKGLELILEKMKNLAPEAEFHIDENAFRAILNSEKHKVVFDFKGGETDVDCCKTTINIFLDKIPVLEKPVEAYITFADIRKILNGAKGLIETLEKGFLRLPDKLEIKDRGPIKPGPLETVLKETDTLISLPAIDLETKLLLTQCTGTRGSFNFNPEVVEYYKNNFRGFSENEQYLIYKYKGIDIRFSMAGPEHWLIINGLQFCRYNFSNPKLFYPTAIAISNILMENAKNVKEQKRILSEKREIIRKALWTLKELNKIGGLELSNKFVLNGKILKCEEAVGINMEIHMDSDKYAIKKQLMELKEEIKAVSELDDIWGLKAIQCCRKMRHTYGF